LFLLSQTKVNEEEEESEQQAFENAIMEVHIQYNLRSNKTNDNPTKKAVETKKTFEAKKTSDVTPKKVPEKNKFETPVKRNPEASSRTTQTEVASTSQQSTSVQRTMADKP